MAARLMLGMGVPTFLNGGISVLAPFLIADLSLSPAEFGLLATVAYLVAMGTAVLSGRLADRVSTRKTMLVLFGLSISSMLLLATSVVFLMAIAAAVLIGLSEGANAPVTNRLVARSIHSQHQGLAIGIKQSGVKVPHLMAGAVPPTLALAWGWRLALGIGMVFGLVGIGPTIALVGSNGGAGKNDRSALHRIDRRTWVLAAYAGIMGMAKLPSSSIYLCSRSSREDWTSGRRAYFWLQAASSRSSPELLGAHTPR